MKTLIQFTFDVINSMKALLLLLAFVLFLCLATTAVAFAQNRGHKCPIKDKQLSKMTIISEVYDSKTNLYVKTYRGDYGTVEVRLHNVSKASYKLHKGQITIPSDTDLLVYVYWENKNSTAIFSNDEIRIATGQMK